MELAGPHPSPGATRGNTESLLNCVRPTPDSLVGDVPNLYFRKAAKLAIDRKMVMDGGCATFNLYRHEMQALYM